MKKHATHERLLRLAAILVLVAAPSLLAADKVFPLATGSVLLSDVTDQVGVRFTGMRFVPGQNRWLVDACLTNHSDLAVPAPLVLWIDTFSGTTGPISPDGTEGSNPSHAYYDFTALTPDGLLWPADKTQTRTLTLGYNGGAPSVVGRIYAQWTALPSGLALARTLDDAGQPLRDVTVTETSPLGIASRTSDPVFGLVTLGRTNGAHTWSFTRAGHLPVWRRQSLAPGEVALTPSPRLTPRASGVVVPLAGGNVARSGIQVTVPPGTFPSDTLVTLTPLTGQTLPGLLPLGWSPLQSFWIESTAEPGVALPGTFPLWGPVFGGESAVLARWSTNDVRWDVVRVLAGPATNINTTLSASGAYAVVVPDAAPGAPASAVVGQPLPAVTAPVTDYARLTAGGAVDPSISQASRVAEKVTGLARLTITNSAGALPSGLVLRCDVGDDYALADGAVHRTPGYEHFIVGYQRPGDTVANTLQCSFPMRPRLRLGSEQLLEAMVQADVLAPTAVGRRALDPNGGTAGVGAIRIQAAAGDFARREALYLRPLEADDLALLSGSNFTAVAAFDLGVTGVTPGRRLRLQISGLPTNALFVLARVLSDDGIFGLEPVERLTTDALGNLVSREPATGERLPGLTGASQFALVRVTAAQGVVTGVARNATGQPAAGLPVRVEGQPWLAISGAGGVYRLLAPTGPARISVTDVVTGDTGQTSVTIVSTDVPVSANPGVQAAGPHVVSIMPTNGAASVSRVSSVTVQFSEAINPATVLANGVQLLGSNGQPVAVSMTLNLQGTIATLLPSSQLAASTLHTVRLSTNLTDTTGLRLEGAAQFTFTTESDELNRMAAKLTSYEPVNGVAKMIGSSGAAEPNSAVILVNDTTGQTATILSKSDGSFSNSIPADVDDFLSAVLVNANGTQNTIPVSRQIFRDGSVGLFHGGGILEAQSDGGPVQVIVEPGSIPNKTTFKIESVRLNEVLALVSNTPPVGGRVLGGFRYRASGEPMLESPDISFPVALHELGLPAGVPADQATFALALPRQLDGVTVYEVVDKMEYENGRLVTHSYPFPGIYSVDGTSRLYTPIYVGVGAPGRVTGRVLAGAVDTFGKLINEGEALRLAGARVVAFAGSTIQSPGNMTAGTVFATSLSPNGTFALTVPASRTGTYVSLFAQHPAYAQASRVATLLVKSDTSPAVGDLIIAVSEPGEKPDTIPPKVLIDHEPDNSKPNEDVVILVRATDDQKIPATAEGLKVTMVTAPVSLDPDISDEDLEVLDKDGNPIGTGDLTPDSTPTQINISTREARFTLKALTAAQIDLTVSTTDGQHALTETYSLRIGGELVTAPGNLSASNPNDDTKPNVVWSYPSEGSAGFAPGETIRLRFSEPIKNAILVNAVNPGDIELKPTSSSLPTPVLSRIELDAYQTDLTLWFEDVRPASEYKLKVNSTVVDLRGNPLDWLPFVEEDQAFELVFTTASTQFATLPDLTAGGGIAVLGRYAFALDRANGTDGRIVVYDLHDSTSTIGPAPTVKTNISVDSPRDLKVIPSYAYQRNPDEKPETNSLLVVVGGAIGSANKQYLKVVNISDPEHPKPLAFGYLASRAVIKTDWSAPVLGYLDVGTPSAVGVVNLQKFIFGCNTKLADYPTYFSDDLTKQAGVDANGDGDYVDVDEGDVLPLPARSSARIPGWEREDTVLFTDQSIIDFSIERGGDYVGVLLRPGHELDVQNKPLLDGMHDVSGGYEILHYADLDLFDLHDARYPFATDTPKRLKTLFGLTLNITNTNPERFDVKVVDLALISVNAQISSSQTEPRLVVLDVTDPLAPALLAQIKLPTTEEVDLKSGPYSILQREDGLLVVALRDSLVLIDPQSLGLVPPNELREPHPAVVGTIREVGSTHFSFFASTTGLIGVADGRLNRIFQQSPTLRFVQFTNDPPFLPEDLAGATVTARQALLASMAKVDSLLLSRNATVSGVVESDLSPPNPDTHYYLLLDAPGYAGGTEGTVQLALQSLDYAGQPLLSKHFNFPPVQTLSTDAQTDLGQTVSDNDAPVASSTAWRLSNDQASPDYNRFLTLPIALIQEGISKTDLAALKVDSSDPRPETLNREILWSGHYLRGMIDPVEGYNENIALSKFAASVDTDSKSIKPGTMVIASSFPGDTVLGPNPTPIGASYPLPGTLGMVDALNAGIKVTATDLALPGRRMPIAIQRTYVGQNLYFGAFGRGWEFNYNQRLTEVTPDRLSADGNVPLYSGTTIDSRDVANVGDLLFATGTGQVLVYKAAGMVAVDGTITAPDDIKNDPLLKDVLQWTDITQYYLPPKRVFNYIVKRHTGEFCLIGTDGTLSWFNNVGLLTRIEDRFVNSLNFLYDNLGRLTVIEDELKRQIQFGYYLAKLSATRPADLDIVTNHNPSLGHVARIKDYSGREVFYAYGDDGVLAMVASPDPKVPSTLTPVTDPALVDTFRTRRTTSYTYSAIDSPTTKTVHSLTGILLAQNDGGVSFISVSGYGTRGPDAIDKLQIGKRTYTITADGNWLNSADAASLGSKTIKISATGDNGTEETSITFDAHRFPSVIQQGSGSEALTTYPTFDAETGLLKSIIYPGGRKESFVYHPSNLSLRSRGNLRTLTRTPATDRSQPATEVSATFDYDSKYQLPSGDSRDFKDQVTTTSWETANNNTFGKMVVTRVVTPAEGSSETLTSKTTYSVHGQIEKVENFDGTTREWSYDDDTGFVSSTKQGDLLTTYDYGTETQGPHVRGLPWKITDPNRLTTEFTYDDLDQLLQTKTGDAYSRSSYDGNGYQIGRARLVDKTDSIWQVETDEYNQFGFRTLHTIHQVETRDGTTEGPVDLSTVYTPKSTHDFRLDTLKLPDDRVIQFTYDGLGRVSTRSVSNPTGSAYQETHGYNSAGLLSFVTQGTSGNTTTIYDYDGHDRLFKKTTPAKADWITLYDDNDNVLSTSASTASGQLLAKTRFEYDELNRPRVMARAKEDGMSETQPSKIIYSTGSKSILVKDPLGAESKRTYDTAGRAQSISLPTASIINTFGTESQLDLEKQEITFTDTAPPLTDEFSYNDLHQVEEHRDTLQQPTTFDVGLDGRVLGIKDRELNSRSFTRTRLGELASETDDNNVTRSHGFDRARRPNFSGPEVGGSLDASYDSGGRLEKVSLPNGTTGETRFENFSELNVPQTVQHPRGFTETRTYYASGMLNTRSFGTAPNAYASSFTYDELNRPKQIKVPAATNDITYDVLGFAKQLDFTYPEIGSFTLNQTAFDNLRRETLTYANGRSKLTYDRPDATGRLKTLTSDLTGTIVQDTTYRAGERISKRVLGANKVQLDVTYDSLLRPTDLKYTKVGGTGTLLAEVSYTYSAEGMIVARQFVHRGRADFFQYDNGYRLTRADVNVRPSLPGDTYTLTGFTVPSELGGNSWTAGDYARVMTYATDSDRLASTTPYLAANSGALPPFPQTFTLTATSGDQYNFQFPEVYSTSPQLDAAGNVTKTKLHVRTPSSSQPVEVGATLVYDELNRLVTVLRDDGVGITNTYGPNGLRIRRQVVSTGGNDFFASDTAFIYDGDLLIEEFDIQANHTKALYYYVDGQDVPVAGDFWNVASYDRYYYLTDRQGSVMAVANANGDVVERMDGDPWGQTRIAGLDTRGPVIAKIAKDGADLLVVFSERIVPPPDPATAFTLTDNGSPRSFTAQYDDDASGYTFGSVVRLRASPTVSGNLVIQLAAGKFADEWGNKNAAASIPISNVAALPSGTIYSNPTVQDTSAPVSTRSNIDSPFLFHGQVFDYDTGLVYLRARFYDPATGLFLQPDPMGFKDAANLYTAFANNPVNLRDPSGAEIPPPPPQDLLNMDMSDEEFRAYALNITNYTRVIGDDRLYLVNKQTRAVEYFADRSGIDAHSADLSPAAEGFNWYKQEGEFSNGLQWKSEIIAFADIEFGEGAKYRIRVDQLDQSYVGIKIPVYYKLTSAGVQWYPAAQKFRLSAELKAPVPEGSPLSGKVQAAFDFSPTGFKPSLKLDTEFVLQKPMGVGASYSITPGELSYEEYSRIANSGLEEFRNPTPPYGPTLGGDTSSPRRY